MSDSAAILFLVMMCLTVAFILGTATIANKNLDRKTAHHARIRVHNKGSLTDPFTNSYKRAYVIVQIFDETKSYLNPKGHQLWIVDGLDREVIIGRTYDVALRRQTCGWTITNIEKVPPTNYS